MMRIPSATYRLQFTPDFGFEKARQILDYLKDLGISDIYASPIFKAQEGSTHGYDVVDPNALNPELGTEEQFLRLSDAARQREMGWLQDIVPNHMAFDKANPYLVDLLENGSSSRYYHFFDILWDHYYDILQDRVLAPFLGDFFGDALENGQIQIAYDQEGFAAHYYDLRFALKIESYRHLLIPPLENLRQELGEENPDYIQLLGVLYVLETLRTVPGDQDRYNQVKFIKNTLWSLHQKNRAIRQSIDSTVKRINGRQGHLESFVELDNLLAEQNFRLSFWKVATEEINYRRFFSINSLISLQAERPEVFENTHSLILQLAREGRFTGLRIDHLDGLHDPGEYLARLRQNAGDLYISVEKILEPGEPLFEWPVQGTTGYEFMNRITGLFCRRASQKAFSRLYSSFTGLEDDYQEMVYKKKRLIIERHMIGDINNLSHLLKTIASRYRYGSDITLYSLRGSLMEIMACFPVYRTYFSPEAAREIDRRYIREAIRKALEKNPGLTNEIRFLQKILLLEMDDFLPEEEKEQWLQFVMRFQQFTGPLMAKGFEDTLLYVYNRLISLNEVGGGPDRFGFTSAEMHGYLAERQKKWPLAQSASATHDTKRGEDVRARINVLSEIPQEWSRQIKLWSRANRRHKGRIGRRKMPAANDEYFLYQTLIGTWPFGDFDRDAYRERIRQYVVKAVREAKIYTAWIKPDQEYEQVFLDFVDRILEPGEENAFLQEFLPFQKRIAHFGWLNSLGQTLIKLTAPGIPDFYQGTELWDLSMVDPDNRRPVDYSARRDALADMARIDEQQRQNHVAELLAHPETGRVKLYLIHKSLQARSCQASLFCEGDYLPLQASGPLKNHLFAYARRLGDAWAITAVPLGLASVLEEGELPLGEFWGTTRLHLPEGAPCAWSNALSGESWREEDALPLQALFQSFPVALLLSSSGGCGQRSFH